MEAVLNAQEIMHGKSIVRIVDAGTGEHPFVKIPTVFHTVNKIEIPSYDGVRVVLGSGFVRNMFDAVAPVDQGICVKVNVKNVELSFGTA